jgi:hypothetical protein
VAFSTLVLVGTLLGACNGAAPIYCTPDETMCHGSCSALYKDAQNCGACDAVCGQGLVCSQGTCAPSCAPNLEQCGSSCVETFIDSDNCGSCGHSCGAGEVCQKGQCTSTCADNQKLCLANKPFCASIASDNANCGDCNVHCPPKEVCSAGVCSTSCGIEQTLCNDECVNLQSDASHCGSCTNFCVGGEHCVDAVCTCPQGQMACISGCTDTNTDKNNCGGCGQVCTGTCEGGRCASVLDYTSTPTEALAQDATYVYWTETTGELHQGKKATPSYHLLETGVYTSSLAVDSTNIYWPDGAAIDMAEISGNTSTTSQALPYAANEVTTDGSFVYVADATGIRRFASGGGLVASIISDSSPHSLVTTTGLIFWANDTNQLQRANVDGSSQSTLATLSSTIGHVVTDGVNVYFTWGGYVLFVPVQASAVPLALASGIVGLGDIATDGAYVYWVEGTGISKVPVTGGAATKLHTQNGIAQILVDSSAVYWTSSSAQIGKLTPK